MIFVNLYSVQYNISLYHVEAYGHAHARQKGYCEPLKEKSLRYAGQDLYAKVSF